MKITRFFDGEIVVSKNGIKEEKLYPMLGRITAKKIFCEFLS